MLRDAARHAPESAGIWTNLGNVLLGSGDADAAIEAYRRAVEIAPDYAAPYNNLGTIHRARDELAEAEAAYRKAIELDPDFANSWHNLAVVMLSTERFDEAVECGLKAVALNPRHLFPLKLVGLAYARRGALDKAAGIFRAWLEKEPGSVLAQHHLAACEGRDVPARASDAYIETTFDGFAASFDAKLSSLGYRAPGLVADAVRLACGADARGLRILDAGCGTGLCGPEVRPMAKSSSAWTFPAACSRRRRSPAPTTCWSAPSSPPISRRTRARSTSSCPPTRSAISARWRHLRRRPSPRLRRAACWSFRWRRCPRARRTTTACSRTGATPTAAPMSTARSPRPGCRSSGGWRRCCATSFACRSTGWIVTARRPAGGGGL